MKIYFKISFTTKNLIKICIFLLLFSLLWQYGFLSYSENYFRDWNTGVITTLSLPEINIITSVLARLMYLSAVLLFFLHFGKKRKANIWELLYLCIVFDMLLILAFKTNDVINYILDLGQWTTRMGIMTILACSIYFYAYDEEYWEYIRRLICWCVLLASVLCTVFMITQPEIYLLRQYAYKWLHGFGVIIRLGAWIFIFNNKKSKWLNVYILAVYLATLICLQARLYIVDFVLQFVVILVLLHKNQEHIPNKSLIHSMKRLAVVCLLLFGLVVVLVLMPHSPLMQILPDGIQKSIIMFSDRLTEDTRSGQTKYFFTYFWKSFPFGVGYNTAGIESGVGSTGIDCGYLNTMYLDGLLMVLLLICFTNLPAYLSFLKKLDLPDIAVVARTIAWTVVLLSSASTALDIEFLFYIICSGRCAGILRTNRPSCARNNKNKG